MIGRGGDPDSLVTFGPFRGVLGASRVEPDQVGFDDRLQFAGGFAVGVRCDQRVDLQCDVEGLVAGGLHDPAGDPRFHLPGQDTSPQDRVPVS